MPNVPTLVPLADIAEPDPYGFAIGPFGSRMKADQYTAEGFAVIRGTNITEHGRLDGDFVRITPEFARSLGSAVLRPGDLVLPHRGAIGRAAIVPTGDYVLSTSLMRVRINQARANPRFVLHFLCSRAGRAEVLKFASTVGTPGIGQPLRSLRQVQVPLPPLSTQAAIADSIEALDHLISSAIDQATKAHDLAAALLASAMSPSRACRPIGDIAELTRGLSYKGAGLARGGRPMVNMGSAEDGGWLKRSGWKYYIGDFKPRHLATSADVLVVNTEQTWRNEIIGWPLLIPSDVGSALFSHHVYKIAMREGWQWMQLPLWAHLYSPEARASLTGAVRGTTVANLPIDALQRLRIPLLDREDPTINAAAALLEVAWDSELQAASVGRVRDELLPLLMSGRISPGEVAS